ncbi:MAG: ribosomal protein L7/L12 [Proteobacteria bacterium]|nr:ribosomal protein L7/L12 [Pseudomonadota bacterium]
MVSPSPHGVRAELTEQFDASRSNLPASSLSRLGRVTAISARGGVRRLARIVPVRSIRERAQRNAARQLATSLGELKGVPMKLGQLMSYVDDDVPDETRAAFSVLQSHAQPMPFVQIERTVRDQLGIRANQLLDRLERQPIAVASIGQVHRAYLPGGVSVAVKVQYPDIDKTVARDFGPARLGGRIAGFFSRGRRGDDLVGRVRERIVEECDYSVEARRQAVFAETFEEHPVLDVPVVHAEYSSRRVLTTSYVDGMPLDEYLAGQPGQEERDRMGAALFDFYVGSLFRFGIYNCDPHPGNYLFCPDQVGQADDSISRAAGHSIERIAVLDHGCGHEFEPDCVAGLVRLSRAMGTDDGDHIHSALVELGIVADGQKYDHSMVRDTLRWLYGPMLLDETVVFDAMAGMTVRDLRRRWKNLKTLARPGELLFLARLRVGLGSVLARLGSRANWSQYLRGYLDGRFALMPPEFDLVLLDPGTRMIEVIREVRDALGIGVSEAKEFVEGTPRVLKEALRRKEAEALRERLEAIGSKAELRQVS